MDELWQRLRQRKLVQWAIAYVAFAFALLQGLDVIAQRFEWPGASERYLILALAVGFFVVLVLAWYHGERGTQRIGGTELLILALLLAIGGTLIWRLGPANKPELVPLVSHAAAARHVAPKATPSIAAPPIAAKSIAVLPFENLSNDKENDYFVAGMQDLILTKLADIGDLKVIARTSTAKYASHPEDLKSIGRQLGVATILEGSVQKQGKQVLINVQLIDTASDSHVWAQDYTRTLDNVFGVEGEVAEKIANALDAKLSSAEAANLVAVPTHNEVAYDLFLRAEYQANLTQIVGNPTLIGSAIRLYRQAIEKDPGFALAYARLSYVESAHASLGGEDNGAQLKARAYADAAHALELAPNLAAAQLALGYNLYWGHLDYEGALKAFSAALALRPNDSGALEGRGLVLRRMGRFDEAIASLESSFRQDPRNSVLATEIAGTCMTMARYADAERWSQRALTLEPGNIPAREALVHSILFGSGDTVRALSAVTGNASRLKVASRAPLLIYQRRYREALDLLQSTPLEIPGNVRATFLRYVVVGKPQTEAWLFRLMGKPERGRPLYEHVLPLLRAQLEVQHDLDLARVWNRIAEAELGLGHTAEGLDAIEKSQAIVAASKDRAYAPRLMQVNAAEYAQANRPDLAVPLLAEALATPGIGGDYSPVMLWLDPMWDPIRQDARFRALLEQYARYKPAVIPTAVAAAR